MKKVSVIILNWNGEQLLKQFLPSVVKYTPDDIADVVVADNGSTDKSLVLLKTQFPTVLAGTISCPFFTRSPSITEIKGEPLSSSSTDVTIFFVIRYGAFAVSE
jgi:GT2 family glycosyltransferase